ncbi:hypothetical protein L2E82_50584 [Cichorium intybus]|nr:hypothetical protein L2E82_50584 [Cichorium intybus]
MSPNTLVIGIPLLSAMCVGSICDSVDVCEPVVFGVELDEDTGDSAVFDGMKTPEILQLVSHEYGNGLAIKSSRIGTRDYSAKCKTSCTRGFRVCK